jgi:hypothetical protein
MTSQKDDAANPEGAAAKPMKKAYRAPELKAYGDLQRITAGAGGTKGDSTPPGGKSKA